MKSIVITGSTRGIGYGLADAFLERGCYVVISGRTQEKVEEAIAKLSTNHDPKHLLGCPCDVTRFDEVQTLWDTALARWGQVDVWINNAGMGHAQTDFWDESPEEIAAVVETNIIGAMYGARVALKGMLGQGFGSLYNVEGLGSDGRRVQGLTLYASTKYGLKYLTDALVQETRGTSVLVGALRPGMVLTDLLTQQYQERPEEWERVKRVFNILADRVETIAPWFADQILGNTRSGVRFRWLSTGKVMGHFLGALLGKRDLFRED